ncbi:sigma-70 family RNA polymerase sigma factor [Actinomadura meridiana]|uniref:Sigma-70 family RNA polymerase sigma factor n=1 Tax=Actinomadura meridiana TaxID=559626 RepID=A0ABP8BUV8_9ACTN
MDEHGAPADELAEQFETHRARLRGAAYRMLGSAGEADDAVQEAWLRLTRTDPGGIDNLEAWLRTVVSRLCLDMLRSRASRREDPYDAHAPLVARDGDPEHETELLDQVGRAMLVVLDTLGPAERVAFVLHDVFAVPFAEIAAILDRTPVAAKKLASRARRRVHGRAGGAPALPAAELARRRRAVEAFLAAARDGDLDALLAVLAPDVIRRADPAFLPPGGAAVARGADTVAREVRLFGRGARHAALALIDGTVGAVVAPHGRLRVALAITVGDDGRVTAYEVIGDPARLARLDLAVLDPVVPDSADSDPAVPMA